MKSSLVLLVLLLGCSGKPSADSSESPDGTTEEDSGQTPEPAADDLTVVESVPMQLLCAPFAPWSVASANAKGIYGCYIQTSEGRKVPGQLSDVQVDVSLAGKDTGILQPKVSAEPLGWQIGFEAEKLTGEGLEIRLRALLDGVPVALSTRRADYDYFSDEAFPLAWWNRVHVVLFEMFRVSPDDSCRYPSTYASQRKLFPGEAIYPLAPDFLAKKNHIAFITHSIHKPNFGLAGADAICQTAGAKVDGTRAWKAMLSTSTVHAKDRVKIDGPVFTTQGFMAAQDAEQFWNPIPLATAWDVAQERFGERYQVPQDRVVIGHNFALTDECGGSVTDFNRAGSFLNFPLEMVWTGTKAGGVYHAEAGACDDFTTTAADRRGASGRSYSEFSDFFDEEDGGLSCDRSAYLVCVSQ